MHRVLCFNGTYEIMLTFLALIWYKINKITYYHRHIIYYILYAYAYYLDLIAPFQTDIGRYCSRYRYFAIIFWCFLKPILQFSANRTRYWLIAEHYVIATGELNARYALCEAYCYDKKYLVSKFLHYGSIANYSSCMFSTPILISIPLFPKKLVAIITLCDSDSYRSGYDSNSGIT